jgi:hypothetical protein
MGSNNSKTKINYEDVQNASKYPFKNYNGNNDNNDNDNTNNNINNIKKKYAIINTLDKNFQTCLIQNTIPIQEEEDIINSILNDKYSNNITIIIYGLNSNDESIYLKYEQLVKLGIKNVFIYTGGMFEWLLLQDIYGRELFSTTSKELDILKYKPRKILNVLYLGM